MGNAWFTWFRTKNVIPLYFQVPALEHDGKVIGESLDLIKYIDSNFEGPSLFPNVSCENLCCFNS